MGKIKQGNTKAGGAPLFSIRNKIIICFLAPILFMVVLGILSYRTAQIGMSTSFRESTRQTIQMASENIDVSNSFIEAEALKYVVDGDLGRYFIGVYDNDPVKQGALLSRVKTDILASQVGNAFISNIHIITGEDIEMISTKSKGQKGMYAAYMKDMAPDGSLVQWEDQS